LRVVLSILTEIKTWFRLSHGWKGYFFSSVPFKLISSILYSLFHFLLLNYPYSPNLYHPKNEHIFSKKQKKGCEWIAIFCDFCNFFADSFVYSFIFYISKTTTQS